MARASAGPVLAHWYKFVEDFQVSSNAFYDAVEAAIGRRQIPDSSTSRVDWKEGGVLAARREYLRVSRGKLHCDICAAPFGTGFFFSWWTAKVSPAMLLHAFTGFVVLLSFAGFLIKLSGLLLGLFWSVILIPVALLLAGAAVREGMLAIEDEVLAVPVIGALYNWIFKPYTYYKIDTELMFQEAVRCAVQEVIDEMLTARGLRGLSELERKPILREFAA